MNLKSIKLPFQMRVSKAVKYSLIFLSLFFSLHLFGQIGYQRIQIPKSQFNGFEITNGGTHTVGGMCLDPLLKAPTDLANMVNVLYGAKDAMVHFSGGKFPRKPEPLSKLLSKKEIIIRGYSEQESKSIKAVQDKVEEILSEKETALILISGKSKRDYITSKLRLHFDDRLINEYFSIADQILNGFEKGQELRYYLRLINKTGYKIRFEFSKDVVVGGKEHQKKITKVSKDYKQNQWWSQEYEPIKELLYEYYSYKNDRFDLRSDVQVVVKARQFLDKHGKDIETIDQFKVRLKSLIDNEIKKKKDAVEKAIKEKARKKKIADFIKKSSLGIEGTEPSDFIANYKIAIEKPGIRDEDLKYEVEKDVKAGRYYQYDWFAKKYIKTLRHSKLPGISFMEGTFTQKYMDLFVNELYRTPFSRDRVLILDMEGSYEKAATMFGDNYMRFTSNNFSKIESFIKSRDIDFVIIISHFNSKGKMINTLSGNKEIDIAAFETIAKKLNVKLFYGGCYSSLHTNGGGTLTRINPKFLLDALDKAFASSNYGEFYYKLMQSFYQKHIFLVDIDLGTDLVFVKSYRKEKNGDYDSDGKNYHYEYESASINNENEQVESIVVMRGIFKKLLKELIKELQDSEDD